MKRGGNTHRLSSFRRSRGERVNLDPATPPTGVRFQVFGGGGGEMQKEEHDERRHGGILLPPIPRKEKNGLISQDRRPTAYSPTQGCEELFYLTRFFIVQIVHETKYHKVRQIYTSNY